MASTKKEMLLSCSASSGGGSTAMALTEGLECATTAAALQALYADVRRCQGERREGRSVSVDYDAWLSILSEARTQLALDPAGARM